VTDTYTYCQGSWQRLLTREKWCDRHEEVFGYKPSTPGNDDRARDSGRYSVSWTQLLLLVSSLTLHPDLRDASSGRAPTLRLRHEHKPSLNLQTESEINDVMSFARDSGCLDMAQDLFDRSMKRWNDNVV
jgi:hypothetical protein